MISEAAITEPGCTLILRSPLRAVFHFEGCTYYGAGFSQNKTPSPVSLSLGFRPPI
jgi:hypothetical protein